MKHERSGLSVLARNALALIYRRQVSFIFSMDMLREMAGRDWEVAEGYTITSPDREKDAGAWALLLNSDGGFGEWTEEKVKRDIFDHLVAPDGASMIRHGDEAAGCFSTYDASTTRQRKGLGMWFIIKPEHRGKGLAYPLCFRTLAYFGREGYDRVDLTTDLYRLRALGFYLSHGAIPVLNSLFSPFQWWYVRMRLRSFRRKSRAREREKGKDSHGKQG